MLTAMLPPMVVADGNNAKQKGTLMRIRLMAILLIAAVASLLVSGVAGASLASAKTGQDGQVQEGLHLADRHPQRQEADVLRQAQRRQKRHERPPQGRQWRSGSGRRSGSAGNRRPHRGDGCSRSDRFGRAIRSPPVLRVRLVRRVSRATGVKGDKGDAGRRHHRHRWHPRRLSVSFTDERSDRGHEWRQWTDGERQQRCQGRQG